MKIEHSKITHDLEQGRINGTKMVKSALIEAKKLLDFYLESTDD